MFKIVLLMAALAAQGSVLSQSCEMTIAKIGKARSLAAKLEIVREFKNNIRKQVAQSKTSKPSVPALSSLHGYRVYFDLIEDRKFDQSKCEDYREAIIFSFSPTNSEPEVVPFEAQQAIDVIGLLCRND